MRLISDKRGEHLQRITRLNKEVACMKSTYPLRVRQVEVKSQATAGGIKLGSHILLLSGHLILDT